MSSPICSGTKNHATRASEGLLLTKTWLEQAWDTRAIDTHTELKGRTGRVQSNAARSEGTEGARSSDEGAGTSAIRFERARGE